MGTQNKRFESIGYLNEIEANRVLLQYMTDNKKSHRNSKKAWTVCYALCVGTRNCDIWIEIAKFRYHRFLGAGDWNGNNLFGVVRGM